MSKFSKGDMVYLISDRSVKGAVIDIHESDTVTTYTVFIGEKGMKTYFETQLASEETESSLSEIDRNAFDAAITAALIRDPSMSSLYSINSAKIDFIPHQFRPVLKFIRSDRPRLLIADGVGVGKTIEAGLILREMQARRNIESVLIICPRPLITEQKWEREMKRFDQDFEPMNGENLRYCLRETEKNGVWPEKFSKAVIPFSLFDEKNVMGKKSSDISLLKMDNPPKFDLVIVDEAHHIRNTKTFAYAAVKHLCDNAEAVVFLTATPVQLEYDDLFVMMNLLRPDLIINKDVFHNMAKPNEYINKAAAAIRNRKENWENTAVEALENALYNTEWGNLVLSKNPVAYNSLSTLLSGDISDDDRVKLISDVENLHTFSNMISRTRRRDIGEFTIRKAITVTVDFTPEQRKLHNEVLALSASIMMTLHGSTNVKFLLTTLRRQTASCIFGLVPFLNDILTKHVSELDDFMYIDEMSDDENDEVIFYGEAVDKIGEIIEFAKNMSDYDPKYISLVDIINEKHKTDKNKIMIFSSFRHTLRYLYDRLLKEGIRVGIVHGGVPDDERRELRHRFELDRNDDDSLDILLFSEVGCEGLDYQFCDCMVNYDLPWNPMRIEQRIGRIDRNGQKSESVSIYNLVTPGTVDYDIYDRCTGRIGVFKQSIGDCEEILGSLSSDIMHIVENTALTDEDRKEKLQQLADNKIRMVQEQIQLEDKQKDLFGIRLPESTFRKDVENATNYWLLPNAIRNLLRVYLKEILGGDKEYITGEKAVKDLRLSQKAKEKLISDYERCNFPKNSENKAWEKILRSAETHVPITFLPEAANDERNVVLISLAHPFVKQAAMMLSVSENTVTFFKAVDNTVEKGIYPFIVYQWMYSGDHEDVALKPLSSNTELNKHLLDILKKSECCDKTIDVEEMMWDNIESIHHNLWDCELQMHRINSSELITYKLGTLTTGHQSRISFIREMIRKSGNPKIRMMREAELRNANADFEQRKRKLEQTMDKVDIVASKLAYGVLIVENE